MSGYANEKKIFIPLCLSCIICTLFILLTTGCGGDASAPASADNNTADATRTGSASFSVKWHTNDTVSVAAHDRTRSAIADCTAIGVTKITCTVYDENNNPVASSKQWDCTDGGAKMERIPAGSNLTFTIMGWDTADGNIIFQGTAENPVTIVAGQTIDAGTIHANPFVPTGFVASATAADQIELIWEDMGAPSYRVYHNGTVAATPTSPAFLVTGLSEGTSYCYTVSAVDVFGNESGQSIQACAITGSPNDDQAPTTPTDAAAAAVSASQIDISWSASTDDIGVSGYRVYRDGQEAGTTTSTSFSDVALQANTQYCYTIEAYDASNNQSAQTDQVCATTVDSTDTEAPTTPIGLEAIGISNSQIDISWSASTDNVGVTGYRVYRDGQAPATTTSPSYSEENLEPYTQYCYTVEAYDATENVSPRSGEVCASTGEPVTWYRDADQDTYGNPADPMISVAQPDGYVEDNSDCDDSNLSIYPGASEVCNGLDDNCNSEIDENCTTTLAASFAMYEDGQSAVLYGDAQNQEGQAFNSNTLYVDWPIGYRVGLEFNIQYPVAVSRATLQFDVVNMDEPAECSGTLWAYFGNGQANASDFTAAEPSGYLQGFSDGGRPGIQSFSFDVTDAVIYLKQQESFYLGILIADGVNTNASCEIQRPTLTISQGLQ